MATLALLIAIVLVLGAPFVPLLIEWRRPTDVAALPIPESAFEDARAMAHRWMTLLRDAVRLRAIESPEREGLPRDVQIRDRIALADGEHGERVLYATRSIRIGRDACAAYAFAERRLDLRAGARVSNFAYARHVVARDAILDGTVSSRAMRLRGECRFTRIGGMPITLGIGLGPFDDDASRVSPYAHRAGESPRSLRPMTDFIRSRLPEASGTRFRVQGDLVLPGHTESEADLVVEGTFYLGEASVLRGSVRAHRVELAPHAVVQGAVFAQRDVVLQEMSGVEGVLSAGRTLRMQRASIGRRGHAVTAYARDIVVQHGACVHGELVAGESGRLSE